MNRRPSDVAASSSAAPATTASEEIASRVGDAITAHASGSVLTVLVSPRAGTTSFGNVDTDAVRVKVVAPPVEGAANLALMAFLADAAGVSKSKVRLVSGQSARRKRVLFFGVPPKQLRDRLAPRLPAKP